MSSETTSDPSVEYSAAQTSVAVGRLEARALFELRGKDRQKFLHNFCTNDIKVMKPGEGCEALMTSVQGKVLAHLTIQVGEDSLWIEAAASRLEIINKHLNKYIIMDDVQIEDQTDAFEVLLICGPEAEAILLKKGLVVAVEPSLRFGSGSVKDLPVVWQRTSWTSQPNWTLRVAAGEGEKLIEGLVAEGAVVLSAETLEALRIEAGMPADGIDFSDANLAQELARTSRCINFRKGCYLGQEPIARIDSMGHVNQELRRVTVTGDSAPEAGLSLTDPASDKEAGTLTSVASFPTNGWQGMAMLRRGFLAPGTELKMKEWKVRVEG